MQPRASYQKVAPDVLQGMLALSDGGPKVGPGSGACRPRQLIVCHKLTDAPSASTCIRRICARAARRSNAFICSRPGVRSRICITLANARRLPGLKQ